LELPPHPTNRQALPSAYIPFLGLARRGLPTLAGGGGGANSNDRNKSVEMISLKKGIRKPIQHFIRQFFVLKAAIAESNIL
jgi:hypothetical protein